jgi:outer membrane protein
VTVIQKLFAAITISLVSAVSFAQGKVVVFDPSAAVLSTAAAKAKFDKLQKNAEFAAAKTKLEALEADIKSLQAEFQKDGMTWSAEKRAESEKKLQSLGQDYQFQGKKLQTEQQAIAQELMRELGPKMEAVIKQLVDAEKITMIVNANAVMMAKPEVDITAKVTELLDKAK